MRIGVRVQVGRLADVFRDPAAHAREIPLQRDAQLARRRFLHHPDQDAEFDAVRMRLDFATVPAEAHPNRAARCSVSPLSGRRVENLAMRIGDRSLADVVVDRMPSLFVGSDQLDFDPGPVRRFPLHYFVRDDLRCVLARVDLDLVIMRRLVSPVREVTAIDLPVVSSPYMPAAEMPIPCWPRACFRVWNFDP